MFFLCLGTISKVREERTPQAFTVTLRGMHVSITITSLLFHSTSAVNPPSTQCRNIDLKDCIIFLGGIASLVSALYISSILKSGKKKKKQTNRKTDLCTSQKPFLFLKFIKLVMLLRCIAVNFAIATCFVKLYIKVLTNKFWLISRLTVMCISSYIVH